MSEGVLVASVLVTPVGVPFLRGGGRVEVVRDAVLAWAGGSITYAGPARDFPGGVPGDAVGARGAVLPGFVDCHTHLPFFGWRADEFEARLAGATYRDQHGEGGIYRSARLLAEASDDQVLDFSRRLAREMLAHGTTALELKTGYGLSVEAELRQARLARRLASDIHQTTAVTLLACHAIPKGRSRDEWVTDVCDELIPRAAAEGLAGAVDVYVEDIAFTVGDLGRVAEVARGRGLAIRCHADQLGRSGAAEAAVRAGARSADHLNHIGPEGVEAVGGSNVAAVLLPTSTQFLRAQPPPVADLVAAGAAIALASDFNPGTSPCLSMPEVVSVAASLYGLPWETSVAATTLNAAWVLGLDDRLGSLEPGKRADFIVLDTDDVAMLPYRPGHNPVSEVWIAGERVV